MSLLRLVYSRLCSHLGQSFSVSLGLLVLREAGWHTVYFSKERDTRQGADMSSQRSARTRGLLLAM